MAVSKNLEEFIKNLVTAITGYKLEEISSLEERKKVIYECVELYQNFIIDYVKETYGPKDAARLKANKQFANQNVFTKFPDLADKTQDAFKAFIQTLKAQK
ncbi:MAG: hypothetical protein WCK98_04755 [bacterium]